MILDTTDTFIDQLIASLDRPGQRVDMYPFGRSLVLDIVVRALCGPRLGLRVAEIADLLERTQDYLEAPVRQQLPHPLPFGSRQRVRRHRRAFDAIIDEEIRRLRASPDGDELNVLETLVTTGELTDSEIRDQIATLLGAGYDTTSATLAWALLRAVGTPGVWDRLAAEADEVLGQVGGAGEPDHSTLAALDLAGRVVRETLRLHPPVAFGARAAATDIVVGGYSIPRGTLITWSPHLAGRDPRCWPDPLRFDPDRHLDPTPEQVAQARGAWVPFGGGTRNCIGFALAQIELTLILARLAQRIELVPVEPIDLAVVGSNCGTPTRSNTVRWGPASAGSPGAGEPVAPTRRSRPMGGAPFAASPR